MTRLGGHTIDEVPGASWHPAGPLVARVARGAAEVAALERLARRVVRLAEVCAQAPALEDLVVAGDEAALLVRPAEGAPPSRALAAPELWAVAAELARLVESVQALGLAYELRAEDVRFDAASGRVVLAALERLDDGLGWDPRLGAVAWGELVADLLGAPRHAGGVELEAVSDRHPPALLAAVRAALGGAPPLQALAPALELAPPTSLAADVRAAAAREVLATVWPDVAGSGPFLVVRDLPAPSPDERAVLAIDARLDRVVRLELPAHGPRDDAAAVVARRRAFAAGGEAVLLAPPLDPALAVARVPALRRGEPARVRPVAPTPGVTEVVVAPPPPPALAVTLAAAGPAALRVTGLAPGAQVALVRARPGQATLLVPEDGDLVAAAAAGADGTLELDDPTPGERYAAFPLERGRALPPGRASTVEAVEVEALEARPGVGAIEVSWRAPAGTVVVVRHGAAPIEGPADGDLLYWGRDRASLLHDCLDPDQQVHYRAFAVGPRGTLSAGVAASGVALGPPPALGTVRATPGDQKVTLAWSWPEGRSYDRAVVRRDPPWPEGERDVPRTHEPTLVDEGAPLGVALAYELRAALGAAVGRREARVTSKALAELSGFKALPGGRSIVLELALPEGLPHGAHVEVVRNSDRPPTGMEDGSFVRVARGAARHVDEPLPAGVPVHYRACLVLDGVRSPGLVASATPLERAGQLSGVQVAPGRRCVEVRFTPPAERCDEVQLLAGPASDEPAAVTCDPEAVARGGPVSIDAPPGVPWRVRLVPVYQGHPDPGQAVEVTAAAWDDVAEFVSRPVTGGVELSWSPPGAAPRAYRLRRAPKGKDDEAVELAVAPEAVRFVDTDVVARRTYVYALSCRWGDEANEVETPTRTLEATVWAAPPDVERPDVRSLAGGVQVSWLPCSPRDRVHWDGVAVFTSERPEDEVQAALEGRLFTADEAPGLGLALADQRKKGRTRETLRLAPPPEGETRTFVVASQSGPLHRAVLVAAAVGLPDGFLSLRPDPAAGQPTLAWDLPAWLKTGRARLTKLSITRGLEDAAAAVKGLDPQELEELSRPWRADLDPGATSFADADALAFVSWGYALEATLQVGKDEIVVPGPRAVVPRCQGGKLVPTAEQPRGFLGWSAKHEVQVSFAIEGGRTNAWPAFSLLRGVDGQAGQKPIWSHPGGAAPAPYVDADLANFTKGMTLVYALKLERARDGLGFSTGEAKVTLG